MRGQLNNVVVNPPLTKTSYWFPILNWVAEAYAAGFAASTQSTNNPFAPYYAAAYLVKAFEAGIANSAPPFVSAPIGIVLLYQRLQPMILPYKTGSISYKFQPSMISPNEFGSTLPVSVDWYVSGIQWAFGLLDGAGSNVNGYIILVQPTPYTDELGRVSYEALLNFYADEEKFPMWKRVDLSTPLTLPDSSAFASCSPEQGIAVGNPCGTVTELFNETVIRSPLFSKFTAWENETYRTHDKALMSGGSGMYLGGRIMELTSINQIYNKRRPVFKMIDFNEFYEVIALTLGLALEQAQANIVDINPIVCPLTVQDFRIMLRQTIMASFQHSQSLGQDLGYGQSFTTTSDFCALLTSSGTVGRPAIAGNVMLPMIIVENIRSLQRRLVPAGKFGIVDFVPVWGVYNADQVSNYTYGPLNLPVFSVDPAEIPINLIDGSSTPTVLKVFVDFNGDELTTNISKWNEFINYLSPYLSALSPIGTDKGISCAELITLSLTTIVSENEARLVIPVPGGTAPVSRKVLEKKNSKGPLQFGKLKTQKKLKSVIPEGGVQFSPFNNISTVSVTSNQALLDAVYTEIQNYWIMPTSRSTGLPENSGNMPSYQCNVLEPYSLSISSYGSTQGVLSANLTVSLYERHTVSAAANVKALLGVPNALEIKLTEAEATGRGGFFGSMIGEAVGSLFGQPALGKTLGNIVPL
jgi:hypothetical protein